MKPQKVILVMLSTLIVLSVANMGLGIMYAKVITAPSLPAIENVPVSPEIKDDFIGPEGARVELVKKMPDDWYGDVYYVYPGHDREERLLIAQSLTLENGGVTNSFDSVDYNDAMLSPDGRWVALPASCWEETCLRLYDVKTQSLRWVDHAAMDVWWLPDGRLRADGKCAMPRVIECGPFESISPEEPWKMQQATSGETSPREGLSTQESATNYTWEPWGISFEIPTGIKVGKVSDTRLVVNESGVLPDGDVPQMKIYLSQNTTVAAIKAGYKKEANFSSSEARINDYFVTTINYDNGFAGPDTAYLVQIGNNVMEYHLAHAAETAGHEYDDLVAEMVLRSLEF